MNLRHELILECEVFIVSGPAQEVLYLASVKESDMLHNVLSICFSVFNIRILGSCRFAGRDLGRRLGLECSDGPVSDPVPDS